MLAVVCASLNFAPIYVLPQSNVRAQAPEDGADPAARTASRPRLEWLCTAPSAPLPRGDVHLRGLEQGVPSAPLGDRTCPLLPFSVWLTEQPVVTTRRQRPRELRTVSREHASEGQDTVPEQDAARSPAHTSACRRPRNRALRIENGRHGRERPRTNSETAVWTLPPAPAAPRWPRCGGPGSKPLPAAQAAARSPSRPGSLSTCIWEPGRTWTLVSAAVCGAERCSAPGRRRAPCPVARTPGRLCSVRRCSRTLVRVTGPTTRWYF